MASKLDYDGPRVDLDAGHATDVAARILGHMARDAEVGRIVAAHLVDANLCGVESHGIYRVLMYTSMYESGYLTPGVRGRVTTNDLGATIVDGGGGIGIPTMHLATQTLVAQARAAGMAVLGIRDIGHTGRIGAFAEAGAEAGILTILTGGGRRRKWRQVAPYGGSKALLPTNPWAIGAPGGLRGPVVLDFATGAIAGGWVYTAKSAGARLPEGVLIDRDGNPTTNPDDYDEGAILPFGGAKGYALGLVAEMIGEAMLGPETTETNWLMIGIDTARFRDPTAIETAAEEVLAEIRACPPLPGFACVEVPGERERATRAAANGRIVLPEPTWNKIMALGERLGVLT